ncbi:MAG: helix-turn-helix domain-containing protein [Anaerolineaceae bacterium]|nr:helix-turn-helix domain-containing protein [Anaerolineaceae bacterium]
MSQRRLTLSFFGLISCGIAISLLFYYGFADRYSLAKFGDLPRQSIGTLNHFSNEGAFLYILTFVLLFAAYGLGYRLLRGLSSKWFLVIIVGFGVIFNLILLQMYPADASDIYDYIVRGRMTAVYGLNPLQNVPNDVKQDSFYDFATWRSVPSAYGPVWESLAGAASQLAGDDRLTNVLTFKLLAVAGYALASLLVALALIHTAPRRWLSGLYLLMWNPLVLYMTAGIGHHDALMAASIALAMYCLLRRWYVAATLALIFGMLLKFIPLILIPIASLIALRQLRGWMRLRYFVLSACLGLLLAAVAYAPYWHGWETLRLERRDRMYTGSVATVLRELLIPTLDNQPIQTNPADTPITNAWMANGSIVLFGLFYVWQFIILWRGDEQDTLLPVRIVGRVLLFYLLVVSLWFYGWYVMWLLPVVALLEDTPLRRLTLRLSYLVTWQSFLYNYLAITTKGSDWLPWLDLVPVAIYMGYSWGYVAYYQLTSGLRWRQKNPHNVSIGTKLQQARISAGLTRSQISDELDIGYDVVEQYERGEKGLSLDHAYKLAQRLGLSLCDWLTQKE